MSRQAVAHTDIPLVQWGIDFEDIIGNVDNCLCGVLLVVRNPIDAQAVPPAMLLKNIIGIFEVLHVRLQGSNLSIAVC